MTIDNHMPHDKVSPEYRITFIRRDRPSLEYMMKIMRITDIDLAKRFVRDDDNPDYIIASDSYMHLSSDCKKLKDYFRRRKDGIFIFISEECIEPDMNIFDYAVSWNPDMKCGDRIAHNVSYMIPAYGIGQRENILTNDLTHEEARKILNNSPNFCNFIYSHSSEPRDSFFRLLSQYKRVDASGSHFNNTGGQSTRSDLDWYGLSIKMKIGYKFSIAMENASFKGYTSEKIVSSLQAHTVPIYWGDPVISDMINPKAFINCNDYSSMEEVIERVKEIDNDDEKWIDMVTQPWQTEEQRIRTLKDKADYEAFIRNIFSQDIKKARRTGIGHWPDKVKRRFTGLNGFRIPAFMQNLWKYIPDSLQSLLKKLLYTH